jgi:hypothetical protein
MDAPVENAGRKINCLKCGQRLQIPPAERAKTILAAALGVHQDDDASPAAGNNPSIPTAQIAPALPAPSPPTAALAPPPTEPAQPGPAVIRSPSQAVAMFLKWILGDRRFRLAGVIGIGVTSCVLCIFCGGSGVRYVATNGAVPFVRPDIVGKWEPANAQIQMTMEFKRDGTGTWEVPWLQKLFLGENMMLAKAGTCDFKWSVEGFKNPVLIIESNDSVPGLFWPTAGLGGRNHHHYKIEDGTLTITPLTPGHPPLVLRVAKPSSPSPDAASKKNDGQSEFDPNDFERTTKWALEISKKHEKLQNNQIAFADSIKKSNDNFRRHVGKKIRWSIPVHHVSETNVALGTGLGRWPGLTLRKHEADPKLRHPFDPLSLTVGTEISRQRAAQLQPNSAVLVKGTIREISIEATNFFGGGGVVIVVQDVQGE